MDNSDKNSNFYMVIYNSMSFLSSSNLRTSIFRSLVIFTSKFHKPTFVKYAEIDEMTIYYDRKRVLLVLGLLTVFVFVGIFILFFRTHLLRGVFQSS